jgi:hypothetical protein
VQFNASRVDIKFEKLQIMLSVLISDVQFSFRMSTECPLIVNAMRAGALLVYPRGFHSDARSCRFSALTRLVFALSAG